MDESIRATMEGNSKTSPNREIDLVLSINENNLVLNIDENGRIIQFNKVCEKIIGYNKREVINRQLFDLLIPTHSSKQWVKFFNSARENKVISDLKLPLLTHDGQEVLAVWSSFPVENAGGNVDVGLVGKLIHYNDNNGKKNINQNSDRNQIDTNKGDMLLFKMGNKKILFKKSKSAKSNQSSDDLNKNIATPKKMSRKEYAWQKNSEKYHALMNEYNSKTLKKNYSDLVKFITKLEEKNNELEKKNRQLEKTLKSQKTRWKNKKKSKKLDNPSEIVRKKTEQLIDRSLYSVFSILGGEKKMEEFERMTLELDERQSMLDGLESQLISDKKSLNERRNEFLKWREKLQTVEDEIEARRGELLEQEQLLDDYFTSNLEIHNIQQAVATDAESLYSDTIKEANSDQHEILDKISECAAIVQQGILKQINQPFADMMGYDMKELVEKSLLDFVVPEGFSDIKQYYLQRLKGEAVSSYETVLLTKDNVKVTVEISVKPVSYNDERAEMTVVRVLSDKKQGKDK